MGERPPLKALSSIKLALMARDVRAQTNSILRADPIAIIGMASRVPGADSIHGFWELLRSGRDAIREIPADRWDSEEWFAPDPAVPGKAITRSGGFLERIDGFDAQYFGILPREADRMDPQQRLFLEVALEAIDDAGLPHQALRGSRTGVFVASYHNDYARLQYHDVEGIDLRTLTGTLHSVLVNRLSYLLDLRGPSLAVDSACSSSLVAVHLGCQSLRFSESDIAIVGGVSLIVAPELMVAMSKVGFMSPDGRCKTFDAKADGFGRGEGCGILVLKRLSDAIADCDRILAVVRGSAVNQDGHSTLLAAPNGRAQEMLIREALANAQLEPWRVGYVETHGTGTALGDPIEVEAIAATIGKPHPTGGRCHLGAVKANIGHLEAAAGVVGVIKAVLALRHGEIPPQPQFSKLNPHISLADTRLKIASSIVEWPAGTVPRCAAVSSFGVGGTNAHVLLEEAPVVAPASASEIVVQPNILPISARSPAALQQLAEQWGTFLGSSDAALVDICYTAANRRSHSGHRLAVVGKSKEELMGRLRDAAPIPAVTEPRVAFVFSGQGPQWYGMGRELLAQESVYRDVISECDALLRPLAGWSLLDELARPEHESRLDQTEIAQPAMFALQVGLAALWKSWGLEPDAVIGHSVGEIAALRVAGALELAEAIRVVWHRAHIMQQATGDGRMASVSLSVSKAADVLQPFGDRVSIAAVNGPRSVVLSGETAALQDVLAKLSERGITHRMLPMPYAFHSAQMAPFQHQFLEALAPVQATPAAITVYSTVTGEQALGIPFDAAYFGRNMREPVRFADAVRAAIADGCNAFVEISPHPVLSGLIAESASPAAAIVASLRRGQPERETMLSACATLYSALKLDLAWKKIQPVGQVVELPSYPWQRKRHWIRSRPASHFSSPASEHPLLGRRVSDAGSAAELFEGDSNAARDWLADHRVFGRLLLPGAAIMEMMTFAVAKSGSKQLQLSGFAIDRPLTIPEEGDGSACWRTIVQHAASGRMELELNEVVAAENGGAPSVLRIASAIAEDAGPVEPVPAAATLRSIPCETAYAEFMERGAQFGPTFRCLRELRIGKSYAEAWVQLPEALDQSARRQHILHPILVDGALQLCSLAAGAAADCVLSPELLLPMGADRILIRAGTQQPILGRARTRESRSRQILVADVTLETALGDVLMLIEGMRFSMATPTILFGRSEPNIGIYDVAWHPVAGVPRYCNTSAAGDWLLFADRIGLADSLAAEIRAAGGWCRRVLAGPSFAQVADDTWEIDPANPDDFRRVLDAASRDARLRGVIHCWGADIAPFASHLETPCHSPDLLGPGSAMHLAQGLARIGRDRIGRLYFVTQCADVVTGRESPTELRPRAAGIAALARTVRIEHPELDIRLVDVDGATNPISASDLLKELLEGQEAVVALRDGKRWTPRLERVRVAREATRPESRLSLVKNAVRAEVEAPGLDGVVFRPCPTRMPAPDEVRLRVSAAGLNFRDVLVALGMYPHADVPPLGSECAGVVTEIGSSVTGFAVGQRVFGLVPASLGTEVIAPASLLAPVPDTMHATDAAAVPVAFLTAHYGLMRLAQLRRGERALIHAASGGVGLAAVHLARRLGAEVFATAGAEAKRQYLRSLGVKYVMDSRSTTFADEIRELTRGEGVHVVLNSLSGEFIAPTIRTLAHGGRFLEIGKRGIWTAEAVARMRPDVRYDVYDLSAALEADSSLFRLVLDEIIAGLRDGTLHPLPVTQFPLNELGEAMRFMARAHHVGKVVLRAATDPAASRAADLCPDPAGTYWITGGLGALGLQTARWLVERGARNLVLSGRRPPNADVQVAIGELERLGATVRTFEADAADRESMQGILKEIGRTLPPLRGIVHAAGVVRDAVLLNQCWNEARDVFRGKVEGAWLLHELTRNVPLEFFILYSAAAVPLGGPGLGVYPAANADLDALARARRRVGLPALSVAWGSWGGAGMAAELASRDIDVWSARGLGEIEPADGFSQLEKLLAEGVAYGAVIPIRWSQFLSQPAAQADFDFFSSVAAPDRTETGPDLAAETASLFGRLKSLPASQRRNELLAFLTGCTRNVLGLDGSTPIDAEVALKEAGLDSLMAVELRNTLMRASDQPLPATLLFDYPTLGSLADHLAHAWNIELARPAAAAPAPERSAAQDVLTMSDDEAEAALLAELAQGAAGRGT